jgi:hypothetical protein
MDRGHNGEQQTETVTIDRVVLTYNRTTDHLDVGGQFASVDLALDILGRARRALEAMLRKQQALELQRAMAQQARDMQVADALRNR